MHEPPLPTLLPAAATSTLLSRPSPGLLPSPTTLSPHPLRSRTKTTWSRCLHVWTACGGAAPTRCPRCGTPLPRPPSCSSPTSQTSWTAPSGRAAPPLGLSWGWAAWCRGRPVRDGPRCLTAGHPTAPLLSLAFPAAPYECIGTKGAPLGGKPGPPGESCAASSRLPFPGPSTAG